MLELRVAAQAGDQGGTVNARQQDVHQQQVGLQLPGHGQADDAVVSYMQINLGKSCSSTSRTRFWKWAESSISSTLGRWGSDGAGATSARQLCLAAEGG